MQTLQAPRASTILYNILVAGEKRHPWILPANICPMVPITFLKAGVPFKFVDISAKTLHMDLSQAEALIEEQSCGGLLYAHTYGEASTPNEFFEIVKKKYPDFIILDDRCLCIPDLKADSASKADIQLYSTGYAKVVDLNFGGYAFVCDHIRYQPVKLTFNPQHHKEIEMAYKHAIIQQARFVYQDNDWLDTESPVLPWHAYQQQIEINLPKALEQRISLNQVYASMLPKEIQLPEGFQSWRFNIRVKNKRPLLEKIFSLGLFASSHYASLAGIMSEYRAPSAEDLAESVINLFNDHHFTLDQAKQVCNIILENIS